MTSQRLKIGLIIDAPLVSHYVHDLGVWAETQNAITISHVIVQHVPSANSSKWRRWADKLRHHGVGGVLEKLLWSLVIHAETYIIKRLGYAAHLRRYDIRAVVPNVIEVTPEVSKSGFVYRYTPADIAAIRAENFDVLLRFGSGILRGDILTVARFGVLSFHHADNRINRGTPAGFWEVFYKQPGTGFIIQQLTDELDGGNVLFRGSFPTQRYWLANQVELYKRSQHYLKQLLLKIAAENSLPTPLESGPYYNRLFKTPGMANQLRYIRQIFAYKIMLLVTNRVLRRHQHWGVAFARSSWKQLVMWKATRIPSPEGRFLADPFVVAKDGRDYCFVEDYDYTARRGSISAYRIDGHEVTPLGHVLSEPFHLSFPYIFEYGSVHYMIPESAENKDIRLYRAVSFPHEWTLHKVIMKNISAVDSMVFFHQKRWWLLTNINPLGAGDHCSELYAFYTDDPVQGEWIPHRANPLIVDPTRARNGGILYDNAELYRVSQRYGYMQYGAGSAINRIVALDPETFVEQTVHTIEPGFFDRLCGTHHLHSNGALTAFDFVEQTRINRTAK